jgi:hypothetical protein
MSIASLPGTTVWQIETTPPHRLTASTAPVPSAQYGLSGKGFSISPSSLQYRPPFYMISMRHALCVVENVP